MLVKLKIFYIIIYLKKMNKMLNIYFDKWSYMHTFFVSF